MAMTSSIASFALGLFVVLVEGMHVCPRGTYWDHALGKCDLCSSICDFMEQQGTVTSCEKNCPGYKSSQDVPPKPEDISYIDDKGTNSTYGVAIGVTITAIIIIISIVAGALLVRRNRWHRDASVNAQIQDTSAPMLSTGHTREDRREEQGHERGRVADVAL